VLTRRDLLRGLGVSIAAAALPAAGLLPSHFARASGSGRRFLFVFAPGGWDPTRVLEPSFGRPGVSMEPDAERWTLGDLAVVDHPARPSVRAFFASHAPRCTVFSGLLVRSIAHEICTEIAMTGASGGLGADWATRIAAATADGHVLPSLVLSGPSYPGDQVFASARTGSGGQLQALVDGRAVRASDMPVAGLSRTEEAVVDRYLLRRARGRAMADAGEMDRALSRDVLRGHEKIAALKQLQYTLRFSTGPGFEDQARVAVDALAAGVSRCVSIGYAGSQQVLGWDTHANNDPQQSALWEGLFSGLNQLVTLLDRTPGPAGGSLADETVLVVLSEMGRTPALNGLNGKDHWPYTSALLLGPGLTGGRTIGGYDDLYYGRPVDPATGAVGGSEPLSAESLGATLLVLADLDPAEHVPGVAPIRGALS
jgi:uncharacterized protein (DUF1501 family)